MADGTRLSFHAPTSSASPRQQEVMFENERQREVSLTPTEGSGGATPQPRRKRRNINYAEDTFTSSELNADITSSDKGNLLQLGERSDHRRRRKVR